MDAETEKKRKSGLTRDVIVDTAYRMIDRDGMGAFTMRALGAELGVSAMAFYAHFSSREEVLVAVLTRFMETLDTDPVPGERWDDTLRRTMTSIHREYCAHPHMNDIDLDPNISYAGLAAHTEKIVSLHLDQGMPEPVLTKAWAMVDAFLTGFNGSAIAAQKRRLADEAAGGAPRNNAAPRGGRGAGRMLRAGGEGAQLMRGTRYLAATSLTTCRASVIVRPQATPCIWSG